MGDPFERERLGDPQIQPAALHQTHQLGPFGGVTATKEPPSRTAPMAGDPTDAASRSTSTPPGTAARTASAMRSPRAAKVAPKPVRYGSSSGAATATTRSPWCLAGWTANPPMVPAAPVTAIRSPAPSPRHRSACAAVWALSGSVAATAGATPAGAGARKAAGSTTNPVVAALQNALDWLSRPRDDSLLAALHTA
ncbi:hypothetical protein [Streptomyces sp. NPDC001100]